MALTLTFNMVVLSLMVATVLQGFVVHAKSVLPEALQYAVASSFNKTADLVHVVIETDNHENTLEFLDVVENLLVGNHWSFGFHIDVNNENGQCVCDHSLWLIDSFEAFRRLLPWITNYHRDSQLFHFIILKCSDTDMEGHLGVIHKIFSKFLKMMLANVNVLIETAPGEVSFYTFYPFQELRCRSAKPSILYLFNEKTMQHNTVSLFSPKTDNFYGCPLRMRTRNAIFLKYANVEVYFLETVMVGAMASKMNFTYQITKADPAKHYVLNDNSSGPHETLRNGRINMAFGLFPNEPTRQLFLSTSIPYINGWAVIAFRYMPDALPGYFWLVISFDFATWICICFSLMLIAVCLFYIQKSRRFVSVVHLKHVGLLEGLAVFIGGSVTFLPNKNSLRYAFVVLSLGALILRTAYLGKLFDAYRGVSRGEPPHGFKELLEKNYTIYAHAYYAKFINELTELDSSRFAEFNLQEFRILAKNDEKLAIFSTYLYVYTFSTQEERRESIFEIVFSEHVCLFFQQHSNLLPRSNVIIQRLEEAGILEYFRKNYVNTYNGHFSPQRHNSEDDEVIALVFERLEFTFILYLAFNAITCLVFAGELLWYKIVKM